jgi:dTDP-4-dehydrorhamnose reductase
MKNVLILGARGMLGAQLVQLYPQSIAWDREDADVLDAAALEARIRGIAGLEAVINCVAFNDVDGAEDRPEAAFALNAEYPGRLAALCGALGVPIVHYSTNYVFDGVSGEYAETSTPAPLSIYGKSKLGGEVTVAGSAARHYVIRTAVIFGPKGPSELSKRSFVELMLDLASKRDRIQAVDDEINSITYAPDLARATEGLLETDAPYGTYHLTNAGSASWFDLAQAIFELTPRKPEVVPVPGSTFPRKATRPAKAVLLNTKAPPLRHWKDSLKAFVERG